MRRRLLWVVTAGLLLACAGGAAVATPATQAACSKASIARVIDGKQQCIPASAFRVAPAPVSPGVTTFRAMIIGRPISLRNLVGHASGIGSFAQESSFGPAGVGHAGVRSSGYRPLMD